jgi:hypothetical protein
MTDHTYACINFTNFEYETKSNDRKRKYCRLAEIFLEKSIKSHQVKLFSAGFSH